MELDDATGVECKVVTNHGRVHEMSGEQNTAIFTQTGKPAGCLLAMGKETCTYMRVECRRCGSAVQRADCAHVWFQPMYFQGHEDLQTTGPKFSDNPPEQLVQEPDDKNSIFWKTWNYLKKNHKFGEGDAKNLSQQIEGDQYNADNQDQCKGLTEFKFEEFDN